MIILITYDVRIADPEGPNRLRKVARICTNYGVRVQNSVFECDVTPALRVKLENELKSVIDEKTDSIRIYNLGSNPSKITHIGTNIPLDVNGLLMF